MKNNIIVTAIICSLLALFTGCDRCKPAAGTKYEIVLVSHHDEKGNYMPDTKRHILGDYNIPNFYTSLEVRRLDSVKMAQNNIAVHGLDTNLNSFVFNAADLKGYIAATSSPTIELILCSDTADSTPILAFIPVDRNGDHHYLKNLQNNECYVAASMKTPPAIEATYGTGGVRTRIPNFYFGAARIDYANLWLTGYIGAVSANENNTWIYSADLIEKYITKAGTDMKFIEFKLCRSGGVLTLLASGIDAQYKHMYFDYQSKDCILENFNPCPFCAVNPLENCSQ